MKEKPISKKFIYCLLASLFPLFAFMQMNTLNVLTTGITQSLSVNKSFIGILSASYILADAAMLFPVGLILDKFPIKRILMCGITLEILGVLIFATSDYPWLTVLGRIVSGCGHAFALLSCFRLITIFLPLDKQASMMGITLAVALLGGLLAQTPVAVLQSFIGWRASVYVQAMLGVLILAAFCFLLPNIEKMSANKKEKPKHIKDAILQTCKNSINWLSVIYTCLMGAPLMIIGAVFGCSFLAVKFQLSLIQASSATSMIFIGTIVGCPMAGLIADYVNNKYLVAFVGALLSFLLLLPILVFQYLNLPTILLLLLLLGLCTGTQTLGYAIISENNAPAITGTAMGIGNVFIMAGTALYQIIFSAIEHLFNAKSFYLLTVFLVVCCFMSSFMQVKKQSPQKPSLTL